MQQFISFPTIESGLYMFGGHRHTVAGGWHFFEQRHQVFELMTISKGCQLTEIKGGPTIELGPGDAIIIAPETYHTNSNQSTQTPMTYSCLHFDFEDMLVRSRLIGLVANQRIPADQYWHESVPILWQQLPSSAVTGNRLIILPTGLQLKLHSLTSFGTLTRRLTGLRTTTGCHTQTKKPKWPGTWLSVLKTGSIMTTKIHHSTLRKFVITWELAAATVTGSLRRFMGLRPCITLIGSVIKKRNAFWKTPTIQSMKSPA